MNNSYVPFERQDEEQLSDKRNWIEHTPGDPQPLEDDIYIDVIFQNGEELAMSERAGVLDWSEHGEYSIRKYCVIDYRECH